MGGACPLDPLLKSFARKKTKTEIIIHYVISGRMESCRNWTNLTSGPILLKDSSQLLSAKFSTVLYIYFL